MKQKYPMVDYRKFRPGKLNTNEFRHLKLLLFWPIFGLLFAYVERFYPVKAYYVMHCPVDDLIPFNELFLIPYLFWFVFLVGMLLYTLLYDVDGFRRMMWFIIITYSAAIVIYLLFPTCQQLRPAIFERDNFLTRFMAWFYTFDTNTNVCPSIHVMGSLAVLAAAWHTPRFRTAGWRTAFAAAAVLICLSTVFLKQHSVLDVIAALPICLAAYLAVRRRRPTVNRDTTPCAPPAA